VLNFKKVLKKHRRMDEFSSQNTEMFSKNNKIFSRIWHDNNKKKEKEIKLFDITKTRALFQGFTILK